MLRCGLLLGSPVSGPALYSPSTSAPVSEQSPLRKLADELDALAGSDEGTAYGIYHDENMVEVVADRDALVFLAAAFARTATFAESEPGARRTGPFTVSAFKNGSDLSIWFRPTTRPLPHRGSRSRVENLRWRLAR